MDDIVVVLLRIWAIILLAQIVLGFITAERLANKRVARRNSLEWRQWWRGYAFIMEIAAFVPGLGIYLWYRYRDKPIKFTWRRRKKYRKKRRKK